MTKVILLIHAVTSESSLGGQVLMACGWIDVPCRCCGPISSNIVPPISSGGVFISPISSTVPTCRDANKTQHAHCAFDAKCDQYTCMASCNSSSSHNASTPAPASGTSP